MVKVTCVLLHYWLERTSNIKLIVKALQSGSYKPDKIIIFNNNKNIIYPEFEGVQVINSGVNYGGRARYPIALLEPSNFYLFLDDDTLPSVDTLKNFMDYADKDCCLGHIGKNVKNTSYIESETIFGNYYSISKPVDVDVLVGTGGIFCSHSALLNMFKIEEKLLEQGFEFGRDEDIILSISNKSKIVPIKEDEGLTELDMGGVGYCKNENHNRRRDLVTAIMKKQVLGKDVEPGSES